MFREEEKKELQEKLSMMFDDVKLPKVVKVKQIFDRTKLDDVEKTLKEKFAACDIKINPGDRIAITAGSRGVTDFVTLLRTTADYVKSRGGVPFIVPAMGSHGGATAEGQVEVLRGYGITEETVGAPIVSSMEVKQIGTTPKGLPVYIDKNACEADGIILLNRVKYHTSFKGKYESGLFKMLAIGLAKHKGAMLTHLLSYYNMAENVEVIGNIGIENLNIVCGVASLENGYNEVADVFVMTKQEIVEQEPEILKRSKEMMARICIDNIDTLIVQELGKEISGSGMDTNVIGRYSTKANWGGPTITRLGVLDVTEKSHGNSSGMGFADCMTQRLYDKMSIKDVYINGLTDISTMSCLVPVVLPTDKMLCQVCVKGSAHIDSTETKMVLIRNTLELDEIYMSEAAVKEIPPDMQVEICGDYFEIPFDEDGTMLLFK